MDASQSLAQNLETDGPCNSHLFPHKIPRKGQFWKQNLLLLGRSLTRQGVQISAPGACQASGMVPVRPGNCQPLDSRVQDVIAGQQSHSVRHDRDLAPSMLLPRTRQAPTCRMQPELSRDMNGALVGGGGEKESTAHWGGERGSGSRSRQQGKVNTYIAHLVGILFHMARRLAVLLCHCQSHQCR